MQVQSKLDLLCPQHGEKIISAEVTGENRMYCLKCLTQKQMSIEQLGQQFKDLRFKKLQKLGEQGKQSEKKLGQLKKLFLNIKELFNQGIDNIIKIINDGINIMNQNIQQETQQLKQSISKLNLQQVNQYITEFKKQKSQYDDLFRKQDESLRNQSIQSYYNLIEQFNKQIKEDSKDKAHQNRFDDVVVQNFPIQIKGSQLIKQQLNLHQLFKQEEDKYNCKVMAMDKDQDQKILINGQHYNIQIWDFNSDGTIKLKYTLKGHTDDINCLCFSQGGYWFISGSDDQSIRIWKKENDDQWICQQILEHAHKHLVTGIVMNNDEDQFITSSEDTTLKVWMKEKNGIHWKSIQTLTEHSWGVKHLSLNVDCNLLASSSGYDELRIWQKNKDQSWKLQQVINYPNNQHVRIKFIDNNELIATTMKKGRILRYIQNNKGVFELKSELKLNEIEEGNPFGFPIIYNKQSGFVIVRHGDDFTYILKRYDNGEIIIDQAFNGNYLAVQMIKDSKYIILLNNKTRSLEILK